VNPRRQLDLHGSINASDAAGRSLGIQCAGSELKIDADSVRGALSAFSALRASGAVEALEPLVLDWISDFRIALCVNGVRIGRAGAGVRAPWWIRSLTKMPLELDLPALLRAALKSF
jgi:hypothetical protein